MTDACELSDGEALSHSDRGRNPSDPLAPKAQGRGDAPAPRILRGVLRHLAGLRLQQPPVGGRPS